MQKNLATYRADSIEIPISFSNANGGVIDITGWTLFFTIKKKIDDGANDAVAVISKTVTVHTDPTHGLSEIDVSKTETKDLKGCYFYDFQFLTNTGKVKTFLYGEWEFIPDVTRRTS